MGSSKSELEIMTIVQVKRRGGDWWRLWGDNGVKDPKDYAFMLPLFTCKFDELFPEGSPVLLSQTSVQSIVQPALSPTSESFLWKQLDKFHPWFAFPVFLYPWKRRAQSLWLTPSITITQCMKLWLSLSKKSHQLCGNICWTRLLSFLI